MSNQREELYIKKRIIKGRLHSLLFLVFRVFPIDRYLITVCSFEGKGGFGCNAKPIVEELHRRDRKYKFVWFVNDLTKEFPEYIQPVKNNLWNRAFYLTQSKVWIDNYRKPLGTIKRKKQYYLNVNHYTIAIKCTGLLRGEGFSRMAYIVSKNDSDMIDHLVIDSKWCECCFDRALVYDGEYIKTGAPRCDVLYGDRSKFKDAFREKHNLPLNAKVLMYAPTFREGAKDGKRFVFSEMWSIDFERLLKNLETKFGGKWYLCVRVHPQLATTFREYKNEKIQNRLIDESQADDMYEILAGMDAYITDYSSAIFEAGFSHIPAFIYADDIEQYKHDRGSLMWNISESNLDYVRNNKTHTPQFDVRLPFSIATNNEGLEKAILEFDEKKYSKSLDTFHNAIDLKFNGNGTIKVSDLIEQNMSV